MYLLCQIDELLSLRAARLCQIIWVPVLHSVLRESTELVSRKRGVLVVNGVQKYLERVRSGGLLLEQDQIRLE